MQHRMTDRYRDRPFPAEDDDTRDPRHASQQVDGDPLAELARLIGQADPLSSYSQPRQPAQVSPQPPHHEDEAYRQEAAPAPAYDEEPAESAPPARPSWMRNLRTSRQTPQPLPAQESSYHEPSYQEAAPYADYGHSDLRHSDPRDAGDRYDPPLPRAFAAAPRARQQDFGYPGHVTPLHDDARREPHAAESAVYGTGQAPVHQDGRYDDVLYGQSGDGQGYYGQTPDAPYAPQDQQYPPYADEASWDEAAAGAPPRRRRGGTATVAAVLALAVVGTGAAFAYRTLVGSSYRSGEPPIIKADPGPNKVIPPGAEGTGKQIYDRVGDSKATERLVPREEQPVDVTAKASPRVVFPPLTPNVSPPTVSSASPAARPTGAGVANGALATGEEPRRIRTLSIRPDQPDTGPSGQAAPAQKAAQPSSAPRAAAPAASGPMSLSPQSAAPEARSRVASVNPTSPSGGGAYVQVSSQRSEADAQASFRALQSKYGGILGSRSAAIRRADLGDKGVFYRAMVGPFASTEEATQFCINLKSAGGQCVVQRN
jgi:hypothetical protein